jgi:XTP/dITP diphosphohydrolase
VQTVVIATRNESKLAELRGLLEVPGVRLVGAATVGLPEVEETGRRFAENARLKAVAAYRHGAGRWWALADDSGLEVDALGGAPGVWSARYAGPKATDAANNALLLANLKGVLEQARTAAFVCHLALVTPWGLRTASARVEGRILQSLAAGSHGFGYDPVFYHPPSGRSFAEIEPVAKDRVSHRGLACAKLREVLRGWVIWRQS